MSLPQQNSPAENTEAPPVVGHDEIVDASGLVCPLPVLKAKAALAHMAVGAVLKVIVTHPDSTKEFPMLCKLPEFELIEQAEADDEYLFWIKRIAAHQE